MTLTTYVEAARTRKGGEETITIPPPMNVKVQTTGTSGLVYLNEGPTAGKVWEVLVRVEVKETDG